MKIINLSKLVKFSQKKGLLDTMEERKRVKRDLLKTKNYNLVLVCLEADQEIPPRPEPYDVCFSIISGSGTFTVGDEQVDLSSSEMLFVPANTPRGIKSKERMVLLGIQEPH
ncbi:MAG: cupin domain-containing protein [Candidatus Bathycorpusculaceae bacterium]